MKSEKGKADWTRRELWLVAGVFLLAFGLRFAYLNQIKTNPFFQNLVPELDPFLYDAWATQISQGNWLGRGVFPAMPLYPYFLGLIYTLFGRNLFIARLIQILLGSCSCALIYLVGRKVFNRWVGLIASVGASLYGVFLFYECTLVAVSLAIFLFLSAILSLLWARESPSWRRWFITGLIIGLASLARAALLLFLLFLFIWLLIEYRRYKPYGSYRRGLLYGLSLVSGVLVFILPVTVRNYIVGRDVVFIASHGGVNFCIGNNPEATGLFKWRSTTSPSARVLMEDSRRIAEKKMGKRLKPSEVDRFWFGEALDFVRKEPLKALSLLGKKLLIFLNFYEIPDVSSYYLLKRFSSILRGPLLTFGVLAPLGLTGLIMALRVWRRVLPLYLFLGSYTLAVVSYFVHSRYRLPAVPFLMLFGAYLLYWWFERAKRRKYRPVLLSLIPLAIFFWMINLKVINPRSFQACDHNNLGLVYANLSQHQRALKEFKRGVEADPQNPAIRVNLGVTHLKTGNPKEAMEEAQRALKADPELWNGYAVMGLAHELVGEEGLAIEQWRRVLQLNPGNRVAVYHLKRLEKPGTR